MFRPLLLIFLILLAVPLQAQNSDEVFLVGNDAYLAGQSVALSEDGHDDLFAAGERVRSDAALTGSAHMAGRRVLVNDQIGGSLYAFGQSVDVTAPVAGDVLILGQDIRIEADIGSDLRAMGQTVDIVANIGEDVLIGAESVLIDGKIGGDVSLGTNSVTFGDDAQIAGTLHLYHDDPDSIAIPDSVVPADRIVLHDTADWSNARPGIGDIVGDSWWDIARRWFGAIVAVTAAATLVAWLAPDFLAGLRERALERPVRALWLGFLGLSAAIGSLVVFAMTGIGLLLAPVSIILALLLGFAGYVAGAYVFGVALMRMVNQPLPDTLPERAIAAFIGALAAAIIALIPFLGWLFALGLALIGAGALLIRWFTPGFFTTA